MEIKAFKTKIFEKDQDLVKFILKSIKKIPENSVLVITSKIVALSEGRVERILGEKELVRLIKKESDFALKTKHTWLTIKDGMVMASAGIDKSNANGGMVLLPRDSFASARYLRAVLKKKFNLKNFGVLITDSRLFPLRAGIVGVALGYAGFKGIKNYIGKKDIFDRVMKVSKTDIADSLATAAVLLMGEGDEKQPLALITGAPVDFTDRVNRKELIIDPKKDIYAPLFSDLKVKKYKNK
ncbi:MAG: coenzyme F420-0:L-glutamate ligase [Candidatus Paceibacterota bacterium]